MNRIIIGITGRIGAGKDTAADYLVKKHGFIKLSFAAPIKRMINVMLGLPSYDLSNWNDREWRNREIPGIGRTPRYLAQTLGTEWGRDRVNPDLWIELTFKRIKLFQNVVISDVRFFNEAKWIHNLGGEIFEITRPTIGQNLSLSVEKHVSESGIYPAMPNVTYHNDRTIEDMCKFLDKVLFRMQNSVPIEEVCYDESGLPWGSAGEKR